MSAPIEKYVTHWDGHTFPQWTTRLEDGMYQSYHYTREAADQNTARLNELVKLRAACAEMTEKIMSLRASEHALQFEIAGMRVAIASLEDAIEKLERENAALRQDKKRLDWLLAQVNNGVCFEHYDRAAIDAARAKEGGVT
jgi:chromosome segregation ATPase